MQEESRMAYEFALELSKQLITLSTGILTLTITFAKDVVKQTPSIPARIALALSWVFYLGSIWYGIGHMRALTGSLEWSALESAAVHAPATAPSAAPALPDSAQALAFQYLNSLRQNDTVATPTRVRLSQKGVLIGTSAKDEATLQIRYFMIATLLAVVSGIAMMIQRRNTVAIVPEAANGGRSTPSSG